MKRNVLVLLISDAVVFFLALFCSLAIRNLGMDIPFFVEHIPAFFVLFIIYELVLWFFGFWDKNFLTTKQHIFNKLLIAHSISLVIMGILFYFFRLGGITPKTNLLIFAVVLFFFIYIWKFYTYRWFKNPKQKSIIVGNYPILDQIFSLQNLWDFEIVQTLNDPSLINRDTMNHVGTLIIDKKFASHHTILKMMQKGIHIIDGDHLTEHIQEKVSIDNLDPEWMLSYTQKKNSLLHRVLDILLLIPMIIVLAILLPFISLLIYLEDRGPIFIKMKRTGYHSKNFYVHKFRTMSPAQRGDDQYVTRIGKKLRKYGIDELPQIWSIILGEMSFVGPRPELIEYTQKYREHIPFYDMRHLIKPGVSGWAQIKQSRVARHEHDIELATEKLEYDLYFMKYYSLFLYLQVVFQTIHTIIKRKNHS